MLHVHVDATVHTVILQRPNQLQTGPVPDVREPRIFVAAKIALQNASVFGAVEHGSPSFELTHAVGRFFRV